MQYICTLLWFIIKNMTSQYLTMQDTNWLRGDTVCWSFRVKQVWCAPLLKCHILNRRQGSLWAQSKLPMTSFLKIIPLHKLPRMHINVYKVLEQFTSSLRNMWEETALFPLELWEHLLLRTMFVRRPKDKHDGAKRRKELGKTIQNMN